MAVVAALTLLLASPLAGLASASPVAPASPPTLTGTAKSGQTLSFSAAWTSNPTPGDTLTYSDTWYRCTASPTGDPSTDAACASVPATSTSTPSASGGSYGLTDSDVGDYVVADETATDTTDTMDMPVAASTTTSVVGPITSTLTNTAAPTITPPTTVPASTSVVAGETVTGTAGTWTPMPSSYTYKWSCTACTTQTQSDTATTNTFAIPTAAAGQVLTLTVTPILANYTATPATTTVTVTSPTITNTTPPTIVLPMGAPAGAQVVAGESVTSTPGTWSPTPTSYSYSWTCTGCTTGTTSSYAVPTTAAGQVLTLTVTPILANYTAPTTPVTATATVAAPTVPVPTLPGTPVQGQAFTATPAQLNFPPATITYQWMRCTTSAAISCTVVGTNSTSYTPVAADVGQWLELKETTTGPSASGISATAEVQPPLPVNSAAPGISGTPQIGQQLTEVPGHWSTTTPFPTTVSVQWMRCASDGSACNQVATGSTYTPSAADIGGTLQVAETATNATGTSGPVYSALSAAVLNAAGVVPAPALSSAAPGVSGTAVLGATLTATQARFSGNPGTVTDAWQRCSGGACTTISGATGTSYVTSATDVGDGLRFTETATNSAGSASAISATTDVVTAPSQTSLQTSTATAPAGSTVTMIASVTTAAAANAGTVTFTAGGTPIAGCDAIPLGSTPSAPTVCHASFATSAQTLIATFAPAAGTFVQASSSAAVGLTATAVATKLTLRLGSTAPLGRPLTLSARLQPSASGSLAATGNVTFFDGKRTISGCGRRPLAVGKATCAVTWNGLGTHVITARYSGDSDFATSTTHAHRVTVKPLAPTGVVNAFLSWTFAYGPKGTRVRSLSLSGLKAKMRVTIICSGHGCPFAHHNATIAKHAAASLQLTGLFGHTPLHPGAALTIRLSHPGWVGKYYRFSFRHAAKPTLRESCLAVDSTRPSVGCTAS